MNAQAITHDGIDVEPQTVIFPILKEVDGRVNQMIGTGFFITKRFSYGKLATLCDIN
jgi:hypothetical protein